MSPARPSLAGAVARLLVALYPQAWRQRYRAELLALVEADPPGPVGLASLVVGAADAHLRPQRCWSATASPSARMRLSLGALFCCWIALSTMGLGFQQETEDGAFSVASRHLAPLGLARTAVLVGALLGASAIAYGGLPLLWHALRSAYVRRDRRVALLLSLPVSSVIAFALVTSLVTSLAPSRHGRFPLSFVLSTTAPWMFAGCLCAAACALTPRTVLARVEPPARALRRAAHAGAVMTAAMVLVSAGLVTYVLCLSLQAHGLFVESSGPIGESVGAMLATQAALAAVLTALASCACVRGVRAAAAAG